MTYEEVVSYLYEIPRFTKKHTFETMRSFLHRVGVCEEIFHIVHVAGTNGKGSVCAYLSQILQEAGQSVGVFTSPHLVDIRERFEISGQMVSKEEFCHVFFLIKDHMEAEFQPSFFEMMFYIGMVLFQRAGVSYVILETGLGGRLDATNCILHPECSVITKIGLDHMAQLGNTKESIAKEKAGIIKSSVPVVFLDNGDEINRIVSDIANSQNAPLVLVPKENLVNYKIAHKRIDFFYQYRYDKSIKVSIPTIATYQVSNVSLVLEAVEILRQSILITEEQIQNGIHNTIWCGRMEEVKPHMYLDGAHNEDGMDSFLETVAIMPHGNKSLLIAMVADKAYEEVILHLAKSNLFQRIMVTEVSNDRSVRAKDLASIFQKRGTKCVHCIPSVEQAWNRCQTWQQEGDTVFVVGSLYLVGMIKEIEQKRMDKVGTEE